MSKRVRLGFDPQGLLIPIGNLLPSKAIKPGMKSSARYHTILSSVREVGVIEPLVVFPQKAKHTYVVLDGHLRLEALKQLGQTHARCIIATDDEAYTYNKRINRIAPIQEHLMIVKA